MLAVGHNFCALRSVNNVKHRIFRRLVLLLMAATFWLLYTVIHEAGHILALKAFGAWGQGEASLLPLPGHMPHVSGDPSAHLAPWQIAVTALAGPLLPTFLGYLSFALLSFPPGSRCRAQYLWADVAWSLLTVMLVFPEAAMVPMLLTGVTQDHDYSLVVQNTGRLLWLANVGLGVSALANLFMAGKLVKDLILRLRRARTGNGGLQPTPR